MIGKPRSGDWEESLRVSLSDILADHPNYLNNVAFGSERLDVPAGTFDCWRVGIGTEHQSFIFWVSKDQGWMVAQGIGGSQDDYWQELVRAERDM